MSEEDNKKELGEEHNHEHGEDCGCGHDHETVTLTFDDGSEAECNILGIFDVDDKEYIALLPIGEDEVIIYKYSEPDGQAKLDQIQSDEEYEKVSAALLELFEDEDEDDNAEEDEQ